MRRVLVQLSSLALAAMSTPVAPADAQSAAAFDCRQLAQPVERLLCQDPGLNKLEIDVGKAFAAKLAGLEATDALLLIREHDAWLARRASNCEITGEADPDSKDVVALTACLAGLYRERLATLQWQGPHLTRKESGTASVSRTPSSKPAALAPAAQVAASPPAQPAPPSPPSVPALQPPQAITPPPAKPAASPAAQPASPPPPAAVPQPAQAVTPPPAKPAPQPTQSAVKSGYIHPLCLLSVTPSAWRDDPPAMTSLDLEACNRDLAAWPVEQRRDEWSARTKDGRAVFGYRSMGQLADGREVAIAAEYTRAGAANQVLAISRTQSASGAVAISTERLFLGGDRCSGDFIINAKTAGNAVAIDYEVSPKTFLSHAWGITDLQAANCDHCCLGTIHILRPLSGGRAVFASATIAHRVAELPSGDSVADKCLDEVVSGSQAGLPLTLDTAALQKLGEQFNACVDRDREAASAVPPIR